MQPAKAASCKTNEMLRSRLRADLRVYKDAIEQMEVAASKGGSVKEFDKLAKHATAAQEAYRLARERLNKHVAEHGCE
jgi:hypothetical protein